MKRLIITLCLAISLAIGSFGVGWSGDLQKGVEAYKKGDCATAINEWTPLAEQGEGICSVQSRSYVCYGSWCSPRS